MKNLEKELKAIEASALEKENLVELKITLEGFKKQLKNRSKKLSIKDKQKILRLLIDEIVIGESEISINHCIPVNGIQEGQISPLNDACRQVPPWYNVKQSD